MGDGLKALAQIFVGAALSLPKDTAVDIVTSALEKLEHEVTLTVGSDAKVIADGLNALATAMGDIVRTKAPLIPVLMSLIALEDEVRASDLVGFRRALKRLDAARELPRGDVA